MKSTKLIKALFLLFNVIPLSHECLSQSNEDTAEKRYAPLIKNFAYSDSLLIYEVFSNWSSGVAYCVAFKSSSVKTGYYLSEDFIQHTLTPRGIAVPDTTKNKYKIYYVTDINIKKITSKINAHKVFSATIPDKNCQEVDDGNYFMLSKVTKAGSEQIALYEIDCLTKAYPEFRIYRQMKEIDSLFNSEFKNSETIKRRLIEEFKTNSKN
jgi:hypothetical protein